MADKKKRAETPNIVPLSIEWHVSEEILSRYTTHLVVQCTEQECTVSFFEIKAPILLGQTQEEIAQKAKELKSIRAECVSRIVIPLNKVPEFIGAMKESYDKRMAMSAPSPNPGNGTAS
jgi:hypothetical protein